MRPLLLPLAVLLSVGSGCFLPLTTGAPQSASTLGRGKVGGGVYAEFPAVNQTAVAREDEDIAGVDKDAVSAAVGGVAQFSFGLTDSLDLELGVEGMLYLFLIPLPTGGHIGARYQLVDAPTWKAAVASRVGYSGFTGRSSLTGETKIRAWNGMVSGVAQLTSLRIFQPSLALSLYPSWVTYDGTGVGQGEMATFAGSLSLNLTFDLGLVELTPYGGLVVFASPRLDSPRVLPQFGVAFALRGGKTAAPTARTHDEQPPRQQTAPPPAPSPAPVPAPERPDAEAPPPGPVL